jgi:cytochrome bd-type quinol oxidase subunit 2
MTQVLDFVPLWTLLLGMAVFFYVVLDGFDLGVGMLFGLLPVILMYSGWSYWVFRGKVRGEIGYH